MGWALRKAYCNGCGEDCLMCGLNQDERAAIHWLMLQPIKVQDETERQHVLRSMEVLLRLAGSP